MVGQTSSAAMCAPAPGFEAAKIAGDSKSTSPKHLEPKRTPKGKKAGFPSEYRGLSPVKKLAWLAAIAPELVSAGKIQMSQVQGQLRELQRQSARVARIVPTPERLSEYENGYPFPPPADDPACRMRQADVTLCDSELEVLWPANYLSENRDAKLCTFDVICARTEKLQRLLGLKGHDRQVNYEEGEATTSSPTGEALAAMADRQEQLLEQKLEPEDEASLRAEIAAYPAAVGGRQSTIEFKFL
jgi:hypothetical protein